MLCASALVFLSGCTGFFTFDDVEEGEPYADDIGDAPDPHDIAWGRWAADAARMEVGMADGAVSGSIVAITVFGQHVDSGTADLFISRTDAETVVNYVEQCDDCTVSERTHPVSFSPVAVADGAGWEFTPLPEFPLSGQFIMQTIGSSEGGQNDCAYDVLATVSMEDIPMCSSDA